MKPRNREINIFNMSLLDILCGALGAFCFMMIVLLPYYSSKPNKAPEVPKDMVDPKTLQEAMDQIKQLKEALQKMQDYAMGLEGQVNQKQQQITQQQQEIERLKQQIEDAKKQAAKDDEYTSRLEFRRPFLGFASFGAGKDDRWQIYWDSDRVRGDQKGPFKLNPNDYEKGATGFYGDLFWTLGSMSYHVVRDSNQGSYRLVLKVIHHDPSVTMRGFPVVDMWDYNYLGPYLKIPMSGPAIIPIATVELPPAPSEEYNFRWTFPPELNDEPNWKPSFPERGKQGKQDKK